jgi:hypothetical protein
MEKRKSWISQLITHTHTHTHYHVCTIIFWRIIDEYRYYYHQGYLYWLLYIPARYWCKEQHFFVRAADKSMQCSYTAHDAWTTICPATMRRGGAMSCPSGRTRSNITRTTRTAAAARRGRRGRFSAGAAKQQVLVTRVSL